MALVLSLLLCSLVAVRGEDCECASPAEVAAFNSLAYAPTDPATYGAGVCDAYDDTGSSDVLPQCTVANKPGWCHRKWCYVSKVSCPISQLKTGQVTRSYEACGELPIQFFGNNLAGIFPWLGLELGRGRGIRVRATVGRSRRRPAQAAI